jgi:hypothetical protein
MYIEGVKERVCRAQGRGWGKNGGTVTVNQ